MCYTSEQGDEAAAADSSAAAIPFAGPIDAARVGLHASRGYGGSVVNEGDLGKMAKPGRGCLQWQRPEWQPPPQLGLSGWQLVAYLRGSELLMRELDRQHQLGLPGGCARSVFEFGTRLSRAASVRSACSGPHHSDGVASGGFCHDYSKIQPAG